jgi:hypothetical protein
MGSIEQFLGGLSTRDFRRRERGKYYGARADPRHSKDMV